MIEVKVQLCGKNESVRIGASEGVGINYEAKKVNRPAETEFFDSDFESFRNWSELIESTDHKSGTPESGI